MTEAVLVDTNVVSFLFRRDTRAELYRPHLLGKRCCLSFQTVAELKLWAIIRNWGQPRRERLDQVLRHYVVLPYDAATADKWAETSAHRRRIGRQIGCGDCWIAAAALRHDIPLITDDSTDFEEIPGLTVITEHSTAD